MSQAEPRTRNIALNVGLVVLAMVCAVLLYSLIARPGGAPTANPDRAASSDDLVGSVIQVEVRNGVGIAGLAATVMQHLRDDGFDVVEVGNHSSFDVERTQIIDRIDDMESARRVAQALGVDPEHVTQDVREDLYLDATVLIGSDYETLRPFQQTE